MRVLLFSEFDNEPGVKILETEAVRLENEKKVSSFSVWSGKFDTRIPFYAYTRFSSLFPASLFYMPPFKFAKASVKFPVSLPFRTPTVFHIFLMVLVRIMCLNIETLSLVIISFILVRFMFDQVVKL